MAFRIPGTNIRIGKDKSNKKKVLDEAYKRVLRGPSAEKKVEWPEMAEGNSLWYDENQGNLRKASAAGYMREAERALGDTPFYKLLFDQIDTATGKTGERAWSSSDKTVNMPTDLMGYMSKPQYLALTLAHEVAHNKDWVKNRPTVGHNKETFRPYERSASRPTQIEPQYNPGDDIGVGGINEYPDRYVSLGPWRDRYYMSANEFDPTQQVFPVDPKGLARELINRRNITRSGQLNSGGFKNLGGPTRANRI